VPETHAVDYLSILALRRANSSATLVETLDRKEEVFRCLWEPLAVAALNTSADRASATLFWRILVETLGRGGAACRPLVPRDGLSETFIDPALTSLQTQGAELRFGTRLRGPGFRAGVRHGDNSARP
jgi:hypothetical protein